MLPAGARLGPHEILSPLGAGGMGEVYRARDLRLGREVALKVLPDMFASDPEFRERFEREARAVAALSHPNIVQIYDLGAVQHQLYAAMELLDGETLRERLAPGALPMRKALDIAQQIAHGLAAAHARGIVHRDLKPENIVVTRDGRAKILDFGLAKLAPACAGSQATGAALLTVPDATTPGVVLGTVGYMSPEQVRAQPVDARTDIFAFGAVLYEMVTGRRAFSTGSAVETMHAILNADPLDAGALPTAPLPAGVERVIRHCLEKNPDERFHSAHDVAFALQSLSSPGGDAVAGPPRRALRRVLLPLAAGIALIALAGLAGWTLRPPPPAAAPALFHLSALSGVTIGKPAVSPDGARVAFISWASPQRLGDAIWIRRLDGLRAEKLERTGGARGPFWSPDGTSLGFFAGGLLKTIELATGRVSVVCEAPAAHGASWGPDGTIVFSPTQRAAIHRVSATGGTPVAITTLDAERGEEAHRWPQFLPDGRHFLYMPWRGTTTVRSIMLASISGAPPRRLMEAQSAAVSAGDHLLFLSEQPPRLMAWAFDARRLELRGRPFPLLSDSNVDFVWMTGEPGASAGGDTLVYTTGKFSRTQLTWFSRSGQPVAAVGEAGTHFDPALSRDGRQLLIEKHDVTRGSGDVWRIDLERGTFSRLTSAAGFENTAVWSPDGAKVAYASDQQNTARIYVSTATGDDEHAVVDGRSFPLDWSPDGRRLLYLSTTGTTGLDVFAYDMETRTSEPVLNSTFNEEGAVFSPDGTWIAYSSDESHQPQVYLRPLAGTGAKVTVSTGGGSQPQWRADGREMYYLAPDNTLMAAEMSSAGGQLRAGTPRPLFLLPVEQGKGIRNTYVPAPDGQRFLVVALVDGAVSPLVTVLNWRALVAR